MKSLPTIITGEKHSDSRGELRYNNTFNMSLIKRMYIIENSTINIGRGWQGHRVEQRFFTAVSGSYKIIIAPLDKWPAPSKNITAHNFIITSEFMDVLAVPAGYMTMIYQLEKESSLAVFSDYSLGEVDDNLKLESDYFIY